MRVEANGHGVVADELLNSEERADEFLLMGLRLAEGIDPAALRGAVGPHARSRPHRDPARRRRHHVDANGRLRVTQAGFPGARCRGGGSRGLSSTIDVPTKLAANVGDRRCCRRRWPTLHDREAALIGAVGAEAEQAVDAGEAGRLVSTSGAKRCVPCVRASAATSATAS